MFGFIKKALLTLGLTMAVAAHAETADQFVKRMSDQIVASLKYNAGLKSGNPNAVATYVEANVMQHVDFRDMVSRVVGPSWNSASPSEQNELIVESKKYLVRTYAASLKGGGVESIDVYPATGSEVRTRINTAAGKKVMVTYRLVNNGDWKVKDISVGGVWLVNSYAGQFRPIVAKSGVSGLIAHLKSKR